MIYAIDFDGTLCASAFPDIGEPKTEVIERIKELRKQGDKFVLWTCRVGERLDEAIAWCREQGLELDGVNENITDKFSTDSRKVYADFYVDDKNLSIDDFKKSRKEELN